MRYLKRYNENKEETLREFCEMYLSYLMDDGFKVEICEEDNSYWDSDPDANYTIVSINQNYIGDDEGWDSDGTNCFKWEDVKDHYIPFLQMLAKSYRLCKISYYKVYADVVVTNWDGSPVLSTLSDFISGEHNDTLSNMDIVEIKVGVKL